MLKTLVTAAAAAALMTGAAHAGEKMKTEAQAETPAPAADTMSTDASSTEAMPDTTAAAPDAGANVVSANAAASDASAVVTTNMVTNGPIADTPENRAKYGQPLSNAGKRTLAKGN